MAGLVIFKINCFLSPMALEAVRKTLKEQILDGVVVLPPYVTVEQVSDDISKNCEFKLMDINGNIVEEAV